MTHSGYWPNGRCEGMEESRCQEKLQSQPDHGMSIISDRDVAHADSGIRPYFPLAVVETMRIRKPAPKLRQTRFRCWNPLSDLKKSEKICHVWSDLFSDFANS
ncbi:MAG: hypothetical protein KDA78_15050 [Planctomycetaceae bacterium]|nr:hypothetical protein [Planctomycetaceae bacterium]